MTSTFTERSVAQLAKSSDLYLFEDALREGDTIHAVIRGSAVNNDGAQKAGFAAPSVEGQVAVVKEALAMADVSPDSIG